MSAQQAREIQRKGAKGHLVKVCPACGGSSLKPFFSIERAPVFCNVQHTSRDAALAAPTAPISLALCETCELISNIDFDPKKAEYAGGYENSLHFSPHFRSYAESLATSLIKRYSLNGKDIVDIGCGQGDFLKLICRLGNNRGFGFDPSYQASRDETSAEAGSAANVTIIPEAYGESLMTRPASLICCRHVLEHIPQPTEFLHSIRKTIGDRTDTIIFFEVPNALWTIKQLGIWDILYEHCSYFTPTALANVFKQAGFEPMRIEETYGGQFLTIECKPARVSAMQSTGDDVRSAVEHFSAAYQKRIAKWTGHLAWAIKEHEQNVLWGAGTKGVMFLNSVGVSDTDIPVAIDVNPNKHGRFVAGTGQRILPPSALVGHQVDTVIVMNPLYVDEIKQTLANIGLTPNVVTV